MVFDNHVVRFFHQWMNFHRYPEILFFTEINTSSSCTSVMRNIVLEVIPSDESVTSRFRCVNFRKLQIGVYLRNLLITHGYRMCFGVNPCDEGLIFHSGRRKLGGLGNYDICVEDTSEDTPV